MGVKGLRDYRPEGVAYKWGESPVIQEQFRVFFLNCSMGKLFTEMFKFKTG